MSAHEPYIYGDVLGCECGEFATWADAPDATDRWEQHAGVEDDEA